MCFLLSENKDSRIIKDYRLKIDEQAVKKIICFIIHEFLDYRKKGAFMKDPLIKEISADEVNFPSYIGHRNCESLRISIVLKSTKN